MRIFCWNINGLTPTAANVKLKHGSLRKFFAEEHHADIVCFQETKLTNQDIKSSKATLTEEVALVDSYQSFWACSRARAGYSGVVTYASTEWAPVECEADCLGGGDADIDQEGRVVMTDHGAFVLLNVYAPNAGDRPARARLPYKLRFLEALKEKMDLLHGQGREVILVGDLNIAPTAQDVHKEIVFANLYSPEELAVISEILSDYTDVWRLQHPGVDNVFSVWEERKANRLINKGLRMDYAVVSKGLLPHIVSCDILQDMPPKWSDHAPVVLELQGLAPPPPQQAPCAAWKQLLKRFRDPNQRSLASMWGAKGKKPAAGAAAAKAGTAAVSAAAVATTTTAAAAAAAAAAQETRRAVAGAAAVPEASTTGSAQAGTLPEAASANQPGAVLPGSQVQMDAAQNHSMKQQEEGAPSTSQAAEATVENHSHSSGAEAAAPAPGSQVPPGKRRQQSHDSAQPKKQRVHPFFAQHAGKPP